MPEQGYLRLFFPRGILQPQEPALHAVAVPVDGEQFHALPPQKRLFRRPVFKVIAVTAHTAQRKVRELPLDCVGVIRMVTEVDDRVGSLTPHRKQHMLRLPMGIGHDQKLHCVTLSQVLAYSIL